MIYRIHKPAAPLLPFVDYLFYYKGYQAMHTMEKFLPDGSIDLLIDLTESPKKLFHNEEGSSYTTFKKSWISGMKTEYILIDASVSHMIGVHFRPGGCYPFVDFPMEEMNDLTIELDRIWGNQAHDLRENILDQPCIEKRFQLLENFLLEKSKNRTGQHLLLHFAVSELTQNPQIWTIKRLAVKTGISQKHLISLFKKYVGLSPKMLARVFKFQQVIQLVENKRSVNWTSVAYECGYYDQAHFIKEFKLFSGINPSAYPYQRGEHLNYLPIG